MQSLSHDERLRLLEFVCSFVWVDLVVKDAERKFVHKLVKKLGLEDDLPQIERWLQRPPPPEEVDPTRVPHAHRELFLDAARKTFMADKDFAEDEKEYFALLEQLLV
jgi:hypothetical protein